MIGVAVLTATGVYEVELNCHGLVDEARLEREITSWLASEHGVETTVTCPEDRPAKSGDTFTCKAITGDDAVLAIDVVQTNDQGRVTLRVRGLLVNTQRHLAEIEAKLPASAVITCPQRVLHLKQVGDTASCEVRDGDEHARLVIRYEDAETGYASMKVTAPAP